MAITPISRLFTTDSQTAGAPHGFCQFFQVNPCHTRLERPASLKLNANVYAIGVRR